MDNGDRTLFYDGDNHRVSKITPQTTTNYFFDGNSVVAETNASNVIQKTYNPSISQTDQQGNKLFYLYNGHGDVTDMMDIKQNLVQSIAMTPLVRL